MGQRLVVQINKGETPLANAYYHWSAYTGSAAIMTNDILGYFDEVDESLTLKQQAAWLLYKTGARFNDMEIEQMKKDGIDANQFDFVFDGVEVNRNDGLLCVTEDGMDSNMSWEEGRVDIDIETREVYFGVMCIDTPEGYSEFYGDEEYYAKPDDLPVLNIDAELEFTKKTWPIFYSRLMELIKEDEFAAISADKTNVFLFIE